MSKKKILFIIGSPNQTTQMFQIYSYLKDDYDCYFSQFFGAHPIIQFAIRKGFMENTIYAGHFRKKADEFVARHGLQYDYLGAKHAHEYEMVFLCNDMVVPHVARKTRSIFVQEGMIDPITWRTRIVSALGLFRYLTFDTSLNGCSNLADVFCVASEGYKNYMHRWGTDRDKIFVTGIPNFDNAANYKKNNFPHSGYVLVCSTDMRETMRKEDRPAFIKHCVTLAAGRKMVWKLHPNELYDRAVKEIQEFGGTDILIFQDGNTNEMIANCDVLITQYSSVVYVGMALGKEVHSLFPKEELIRNMPVQNGGQSAANIARIAREFIEFKGTKDNFRNHLRTIEKDIISLSA
jgi:hypothetical protein